MSEKRTKIVTSGEIEQELQKSLKGLKQTGGVVKRAVSNFFIIVGRIEERELADSMCDSILNYSPGRAFLVLLDSSVNKVEIRVELRTFELNSDESVSSDLIIINTPEALLSSVPSIVLSRSLTGIHPTLVIAEKQPRTVLLEPFIDLCSQVIFDSRFLFEKSFLLKYLLNSKPDLVDLSWIRSSVWRSEMVDIFSRPVVIENLDNLIGVEIEVDSLIEASELWLLAGWLLSRMRLELSAAGKDGFECMSVRGTKVNLSFKQIKRAVPDSVSGVRFRFKEGEVHIIRSENFQTEIKLDESFHLTARNCFLDFNQCLENFYAVGESTENYRTSLEKGLELFSLRQGFAGV